MKKTNLLILFAILISVGFLRFYNLGYSDYTADEYGAMIWTKETENHFPKDLVDFFLTRKKGPMQYLVSYIPIYLTGDYNAELPLRIPFAVASVLASVVFYLLIARLTQSKLTGFISATLLATSGFISAFGRIAQYQNLNMLFSFTALYFYSELLFSSKNLLRKTLLGTMALALSFLSHWDAIYVMFPTVLIFLQYFKNSTDSKEFKIKLFLANLGLGLLLTMPFFLPYVLTSAGGGDGISYLTGRFGFHLGSNLKGYLFDLEFYNPFLTLWVYLTGGILGALLYKKSWFFTLWFAFTFLFFEIFIKKPGTHIYNFLIPIFVLVAIALTELYNRSFRYLKIGPALLIFSILGFLYFQSFLIFVSPRPEYPWEREKILGYKTESHSVKHKPRYLIGFPYKRYWEEINQYVIDQNIKNGESYTYVTNESMSISDYYMDVDQGVSVQGYYAIGIKRPWSFSNDFKFPQIKGKSTVHTIENQVGEDVVKIYRVEPRDEK